MLEQILVQKVKKSMTELNKVCSLYTKEKQTYEFSLDQKKQLETEKKDLEQKQKNQDRFFEIVLLESGETNKIDEISEKLLNVTNQLEALSDNLNGLRTGILRKFKTLPFPIDPHNLIVEESVTKFKTISNIAFEETTLRILCDLLELTYPLNFEGVTYHPNEVVINTTSADEAMNQIVKSVQNLRERSGVFLKAYSNIDALCERIRSSNRYAPILESLFLSRKSLSIGELTKLTGINRNLAYQACYNMLRESWTPNPIKKTNGKFSLTKTGTITMKRCTEKYGFTTLSKSRELDEDLDQTKLAAQESETKE